MEEDILNQSSNESEQANFLAANHDIAMLQNVWM